MNNMKQFQFYTNNVKRPNPVGWVTIDRFIKSIKQPKQHLVEIFNQISYYESIGDMKTKAKIKERIYYFTPCVHVQSVRRYKDIVRWTGLAVLDFDHINNAPDFRDYLFAEYSSIIAAWLSPSKKGVKALVNIPVVYSVDEFKSYYFGLASEMWQYNGFDGSGQNCVLPLFQSIDTDLLYRPAADTWTDTGHNNKQLTDEIIPATPIHGTERHEKIILGMINKGFDKITGNGHPQLRGLCIAVGGYISNGYIDKNKALQQINYKIETNGYLKKGIAGYKRTANWAVNLGMNRPIHLNIEQ